MVNGDVSYCHNTAVLLLKRSRILDFAANHCVLVYGIRKYLLLQACRLLGRDFRKIVRQFYDNLRNFIRCTLILRQIYDNANLKKSYEYEQSEHYKYDRIN